MSDKPDLAPWGLVISVLLAILTFLTQKEAGMVDGDISAIRDSIANVAQFKLNYVSNIDDAYVDNVTEFNELVERCDYIARKSRSAKDYCSHDYPYAGDLKIADLHKAFDLFSEPYLDQSNAEQPNLDINKLIEADGFLRHNIHYKLLNELLTDNKFIREKVGALQADWAALGDMASSNKDIISKYNDQDAVKRLHRGDLEQISYNICCNVIEMHNVSTSIRNHTDLQLTSFCDIKKITRDFL